MRMLSGPSHERKDFCFYDMDVDKTKVRLYMLDPKTVRVMEDTGGRYKFCLRQGLKVYVSADQLKVFNHILEPYTVRSGSIMVSLSQGGELVESQFDAGFKTWTVPGCERFTFSVEAYRVLKDEVREHLDRLDRRSAIVAEHRQLLSASLIVMLYMGLRSFAFAESHHRAYVYSNVVERQVAIKAQHFAKHHPGDVVRIIATTQARKVLLQKHATKIGVKPSLLAGVMAQECRGNDAGSLHGRYFGPMQVDRSYIRTRKLPMRTVADGYRAGADYLLRECLTQFGGHQLLALAAFNGGYPSIKRAVRWGSLPSRGGTRQSLFAVRQLAIHKPKQYRYAIDVLAKAKIIDEHNVFQAGE